MGAIRLKMEWNTPLKYCVNGAALVLMILTVGCSSDVDLVKTGTTKIDGNVRQLSDVFQNWSHCGNVEWEKSDSIIKEDRLVSVSCDLRLFETPEDEMEYGPVGFKNVNADYIFRITGEAFDLETVYLFALWKDDLHCFHRIEKNNTKFDVLENAYNDEMFISGTRKKRLNSYRVMRHSAQMTKESGAECLNEESLRTFDPLDYSSEVSKSQPTRDIRLDIADLIMGMAQLATVPSDVSYTNRSWESVSLLIPQISDWDVSTNERYQTEWTATVGEWELTVRGNRSMITDTVFSSLNRSGEVSLSQRFDRLTTSETYCDTAGITAYEERYAIIKTAGSKPIYAQYIRVGGEDVQEFVFFGSDAQNSYPEFGGESTMGGTWVSCD
ncbi:MAG: hypothetical protein P8N92_05645 [Burkholderiales bacterium]|nr:hypothetical protein [Burkholderiales bacterium]